MWRWTISNQEWAQLFSAIGFAGYALVIGFVLMLYLTKNSVLNLKRLVVGSAVFLILIGGISATNAMARPPFEFLTLSQAAQATSAYIWCSFFFILAGLLRRV